MSHLQGSNRGLSRKSAFRWGFRTTTALLILGVPFGNLANAALQIGWEPPAEKGEKLLATYELSALGARKLTTLTEQDPLAKNPGEKVKFQGLSLSALMTEATKDFSAADRSNTDLVILKSRSGKEALLPKAFLVRYPEILLALKKNGQDLGAESPRIILPATTNKQIQKENMLLEPAFVSELASIILSSYENRYGAFYLEHRMDPSAVRGEKLFLQNCVSCHTNPEVAMSTITSGEKVDKVARGEHPDVPGNPNFHTSFKGIFDKKATRSLVSYLEAFRKQPPAVAAEKKSESWFSN